MVVIKTESMMSLSLGSITINKYRNISLWISRNSKSDAREFLENIE